MNKYLKVAVTIFLQVISQDLEGQLQMEARIWRSCMCVSTVQTAAVTWLSFSVTSVMCTDPPMHKATSTFWVSLTSYFFCESAISFTFQSCSPRDSKWNASFSITWQYIAHSLLKRTLSSNNCCVSIASISGYYKYNLSLQSLVASKTFCFRHS